MTATRLGDGKVALVVGASRGMGRQIAVDLALKGGYSVVVAAKTRSAPGATLDGVDPNSPESTVDTVAHEIVHAGGKATPLQVDVRDVESVKALVEETVRLYGRLDVVVYNSGAIWWSSVAGTPVKRFQLMQRVNPEGLYATVHAALPHLPLDGGRIIVVSPPIYSRFARGKAGYAIGKIGMSVLTLGLSFDFVREAQAHADGSNIPKRAITSIWPASAIESAATRYNDAASQHLRKAVRPTIFSDAILAILSAPPEKVNGLLTTDEDFLREHVGLSQAELDAYALVPGTSPRRIMPVKFPDLRVAEQDDEGDRMDSVTLRAGKDGKGKERSKL
ncbi:NAD(P)-binding protein [Exidia glandulosa HHB12029]|uniref:NAD(P)-binding protein n=1 Tax=Exidia glandulosa HHB12029 TaxID=1314781 RepID=A0A165L8A6_EXIGL|nr:NAD(P)-binding protein [Exidia glandulosa HHB12029]